MQRTFNLEHSNVIKMKLIELGETRGKNKKHFSDGLLMCIKCMRHTEILGLVEDLPWVFLSSGLP